MSAMSASSGLMPLSLISEHKAAQGGPPAVQPLPRTPEKHNLVQAPKPTPNGMEPSPPLIPLLPPAQPEPQPSLPCGGKSEAVAEEERSGGSVPEIQVPTAEPAHPSIGAVPEQPLAAVEPAEAPTAPELPVTVPVPAPQQPQPEPEEGPAAPEPESLPQPEAAPAPEPAQVPPPLEVEPPAKAPEESKDSEAAAVPVESLSPAPPAAPTTSAAAVPSSPPVQPPTTRQPKRTKQNSNNVSNDTKKVLPSAPEEEETSGDDRKSKRKRLPTQIYQSPIPELNIIAKISKIDKTPVSGDDKLIVFYRNEFLAVRNAEGGFYVCQAMQNVYRTSSKIRIRWLSQVANTDTYSPDFYDLTEFDCILTNLNLEKVDKNKFRLPEIESQRTLSILKRAIDVENGIAPPEETSITEEHPDGLDLSLYRNEDQLKKRKRSKSKGTKKKDKKENSDSAPNKSSRTSSRRNTKGDGDSKKSLTVPAVQRRLGKPARTEKPVVQRIIAAKKMGRRKLAAASKAKKEVKPPPAAAKRKSESQPAAVPEKKAKSGASKTRSGAAVAPSGSQQRPTRRSANRTK